MKVLMKIRNSRAFYDISTLDPKSVHPTDNKDDNNNPLLSMVHPVVDIVLTAYPYLLTMKDQADFCYY